MSDYKKFKKLESEPYGPCGYYNVVDVIYKDGTKVNEHSKDIRWSYVLSWKLAENQGGPKKKYPMMSRVPGGGGFVDNYRPSSAQELGMDDKDFEFVY